MPRYVVRQGPHDYHLYSTVTMGDISGHRTRQGMVEFLRTYGMTVQDAEEMIAEADERPAAETREILEPMRRHNHKKAMQAALEEQQKIQVSGFDGN
jgi:hypothetical protein